MLTTSQVIDVNALARWDAAHPGNAVRAICQRWARPGCRLSEKAWLRIMPDDRGIGLFLYGRRAGSLSWIEAGPLLSLAGEGDHVSFVDPATLAAATSVENILSRLEHAGTRRSEGGCFLEDVIAANPGVIGLAEEVDDPYSSDGGILAVVQDGSANIMFWMVMTARSRTLEQAVQGSASTPDPAPTDRTMDFQAAAATLLALHSLFPDPRAVVCADLWRKVTEQPPLVPIARPAMMIGTYWPEHFVPGVASARMRQHVAKLVSKGVFDQLRENGVTVALAERSAPFDAATIGLKLPQFSA